MCVYRKRTAHFQVSENFRYSDVNKSEIKFHSCSENNVHIPTILYSFCCVEEKKLV